MCQNYSCAEQASKQPPTNVFDPSKNRLSDSSRFYVLLALQKLSFLPESFANANNIVIWGGGGAIFFEKLRFSSDPTFLSMLKDEFCERFSLR